MTTHGMTARSTAARRSTAGRSGADRRPAPRTAPRARAAGRAATERTPGQRPVPRPAAGAGLLRVAARGAPGTDWPARVLLALMFLAVVAMVSLPQARVASASFGWMPLWLFGLPATAWLALAGVRRHEGR